jgi:phospholipid:diacylglycerol acyltransferase
MGNNIFRYFLAWLKFELGKNHWQEWIDKHISAFFSVGAPLLGGPEGLEVLLSGLTQGLPLGLKELRTLEVTFGEIRTSIKIVFIAYLQFLH